MTDNYGIWAPTLRYHDEIASYIKDIDKIIYQLYGLSSEDVKTVNLYATR